jgi:hypothetical protein
MLEKHPANPVMTVKGRLRVYTKLAFIAKAVVLYNEKLVM